MVKKLQKMAEKKAATPASLLDGQLASTIKDSAQQIWLAGLGAFSKAQEEGGKVFEALVKEGVSLQKKTQAVAEERIGGVTSKVSHMADGITGRAGQQWDKLETIFEERVARAQEKLGVPSRRDIEALSQRIDALSEAVTRLGGTVEAPRKSAGRKAPAKAARGRNPRTGVTEAAAPAPVEKVASRKRVSRKTAEAAA